METTKLQREAWVSWLMSDLTEQERDFDTERIAWDSTLGGLRKDYEAIQRELERLRDAAMWVVKNFEEWSDSGDWAGPSLEVLIGSIDQLRQALSEGAP